MPTPRLPLEADSEPQPWSHVAHKGKRFGGVIAATLDADGGPPVSASEAKKWKREVQKFCGEFITDGYEIKTVYSRAEYKALLETLDTK